MLFFLPPFLSQSPSYSSFFSFRFLPSIFPLLLRPTLDSSFTNLSLLCAFSCTDLNQHTVITDRTPMTDGRNDFIQVQLSEPVRLLELQQHGSGIMDSFMGDAEATPSPKTSRELK